MCTNSCASTSRDREGQRGSERWTGREGGGGGEEGVGGERERDRGIAREHPTPLLRQPPSPALKSHPEHCCTSRARRERSGREASMCLVPGNKRYGLEGVGSLGHLDEVRMRMIHTRTHAHGPRGPTQWYAHTAHVSTVAWLLTLTLNDKTVECCQRQAERSCR